MMITETQQYQIHMGDEDAFAVVFRSTGMGVYHRALAALDDRRAAKAVVIETFTAFRAAMQRAEGPLDADALLYALTEEAIDKVRALMTEPPEAATAAPDLTEPPEAASHAGLPDAQGDATLEMAADPVADEIPYDGRAYRADVWRGVLGALLIAFLVLLFAWLLLGALMNGGAIPVRDFGYRWFNEHIFRLFPMVAQ